MRILAAIFVLLILLLILEMLRRQKIREKYAILWMTIGVFTLILAIFPKILFWASRVVGVQIPSNLLFASVLVLLICVCLHLSWELSHAEDRTRRLAEEVAILREEVNELLTATPPTTSGDDKERREDD